MPAGNTSTGLITGRPFLAYEENAGTTAWVLLRKNIATVEVLFGNHFGLQQTIPIKNLLTPCKNAKSMLY